MKNAVYRHPWPGTLKIFVYTAYCCLPLVLSPSLFRDYTHSSKQNIVFSLIFFFFFTGVGSLVFEPHSCLTVMQLAFLSTTLLSVKWGQHIPSQLVPGLATRMEVALGNWQTLCIYPYGVLWAGDPCDIMTLHEGGISGSALLEGSLGSVWTPPSSWPDQTTVDSSDISL